MTCYLPAAQALADKYPNAQVYVGSNTAYGYPVVIADYATRAELGGETLYGCIKSMHLYPTLADAKKVLKYWELMLVKPTPETTCFRNGTAVKVRSADPLAALEAQSTRGDFIQVGGTGKWIGDVARVTATGKTLYLKLSEPYGRQVAEQLGIQSGEVLWTDVYGSRYTYVIPGHWYTVVDCAPVFASSLDEAFRKAFMSTSDGCRRIINGETRYKDGLQWVNEGGHSLLLDCKLEGDALTAEVIKRRGLKPGDKYGYVTMYSGPFTGIVPPVEREYVTAGGTRVRATSLDEAFEKVFTLLKASKGLSFTIEGETRWHSGVRAVATSKGTAYVDPALTGEALTAEVARQKGFGPGALFTYYPERLPSVTATLPAKSVKYWIRFQRDVPTFKYFYSDKVDPTVDAIAFAKMYFDAIPTEYWFGAEGTPDWTKVTVK